MIIKVAGKDDRLTCYHCEGLIKEGYSYYELDTAIPKDKNNVSNDISEFRHCIFSVHDSCFSWLSSSIMKAIAKHGITDMQSQILKSSFVKGIIAGIEEKNENNISN